MVDVMILVEAFKREVESVVKVVAVLLVDDNDNDVDESTAGMDSSKMNTV